MSKVLNDKQLAFCEEYLVNGFNATKAYRKVYESYNICDFKIQHNPYPRWHPWSQEWFEPIPMWKARMK